VVVFVATSAAIVVTSSVASVAVLVAAVALISHIGTTDDGESLVGVASAAVAVVLTAKADLT
jgi:hypothetical protein